MSDPLARLQARTLSRHALVLDGVRSGKELAKQLCRRLIRATREDVLVGDCVHLVWTKPATIRRSDGTLQDVTAVIGGIEINRERSTELPHFKRSDGAWFDFHIHLVPYDGSEPKFRGLLELYGYGYEIRFPRIASISTSAGFASISTIPVTTMTTAPCDATFTRATNTCSLHRR